MSSSGPLPPPPPPPPPTGPPSPWGGPSNAPSSRIIPLHPLSVGELLDVSVRLYRVTIPGVLLAVVVVLGPLNLLTSLATAGLDPFDPQSVPTVPQIVITIIATLVAALVAPLVNGAVTYMAARRDEGIEVGWQDAYSAAAPRFPTLLLTTLLVFVAALAGMLVLAIPVGLAFLLTPILGVLVAIPLLIGFSVALATIFYLVVPIVMLEDAAPTQALRRSLELVKPRLLPVAGRVLLAGLLILIVTGIASTPFSFVGALLPRVGFVFTAIGSTLASLVSVPLGANVALALYIDQRVRHEGLDIQRLTEGLPSGG